MEKSPTDNKEQTKLPVKVTKGKRLLNIKNALNLLENIVKIKLAPSPIHGIGVFAMRDMKKGEALNADAIPHAFDLTYKQVQTLTKDVREQILSHWPNIINGSHFLYPVTKMTAFMNHSATPNYDAKADLLLADVKKGDEITEDYRVMTKIEKVYPWLDMK